MPSASPGRDIPPGVGSKNLRRCTASSRKLISIRALGPGPGRRPYVQERRQAGKLGQVGVGVPDLSRVCKRKLRLELFPVTSVKGVLGCWWVFLLGGVGWWVWGFGCWWWVGDLFFLFCGFAGDLLTWLRLPGESRNTESRILGNPGYTVASLGKPYQGVLNRTTRGKE